MLSATSSETSSPARRTEYVWRPQPGPQKALVDCPLPEVFFGGSRGGGKTDGVLGKWALKAKRYGKHFNARAFRKTSVSFEDAIERAKEIYIPLGAKFNETKSIFRMAQGGRVAFGYLDHPSDADAQQGKNLTDAWIEEAGQYASPMTIDKLFGALRSAHGVPTQLILTANPGGSGQGWIRERYGLVPFPKGPKVVTRSSPTGATIRMAVIPSRITDNRELMARDPGYVDRLSFVGSAQLVRAWLDGDWNAIEGAFFAEWDEKQHVVPVFDPPADWLRFRSMDWGSAAPFSVGWWAVVGDAFVSPAQQSAPHREIPRGALVRYREWYGASGPNVGLKLTAEQVADGIKTREAGETIAYGVLDPAAFAEDGGPSIASRMGARGVYFRPADNKRVAQRGAMGGWDIMRQRLHGEDGRPMLYVTANCRDFIRTVPVLQHDQARVEDLDTDSEDHVADECFIKGTMIAIPDLAERAIEDFKVGEMVATRGDNAAVSAVFSVGRRPTWRVSFDDGSSLVGTFTHPVFVEGKGFVSLAHLGYGDMMRTCASRSLTMAASTIAGPSISEDTSGSISGRITDRFTAICGRMLMGLSRMGISSTMSMATLSTTSSTTLSQCFAASTPSIIGGSVRPSQSNANTVASSSFRGLGDRLSGFAATLASRLIGALAVPTTKSANAHPAVRPSGLTGTQLNGFALTPAQSLGHTSEPSSPSHVKDVAPLAKHETRGLDSAPKRVVSVTPAGPAQVFNLTVEGAEEYFANGVLVHNCRYGCMSRPWVPKPKVASLPENRSGFSSQRRPSGGSFKVL